VCVEGRRRRRKRRRMMKKKKREGGGAQGINYLPFSAHCYSLAVLKYLLCSNEKCITKKQSVIVKSISFFTTLFKKTATCEVALNGYNLVI